jgi:hypothetical protein
MATSAIRLIASRPDPASKGSKGVVPSSSKSFLAVWHEGDLHRRRAGKDFLDPGWADSRFNGPFRPRLT